MLQCCVRLSLKVDTWQRTSGSRELIEIGILWSYDTEIQNSGKGNRSRTVPGYRNRGRQRRRRTDDIAEWTGMKINEVAVAAEDRDHWRGIRAANRKALNDNDKDLLPVDSRTNQRIDCE